MTVPQQTPVSNCWGNNSATEFSFNFYIAKESELLVEHTDLNGIKSTLENGVDYSIHQVGNTEGSYITFPLAGSKYKTLAWDTSTDKKELLTLSLTLPIQQIAEYKDSGDLSKHNLELSFDYAIRLIQILARTISRAVKVSEGDKVTPDQLIESLNESKRIAVDAANSAKSQAEYAHNSANVAKDKADIATQKATEATDIINNSLTSIENKTQEELNKIHATGIDTKLNKTQLTNCILEVPQRIKWEVIDGVFYIKAGSVLTRPNGWIDKGRGIRKFEYVTISEDIGLINITSGVSGIKLVFLALKPTGGVEGLWYFAVGSNIYSDGVTPESPIANSMWYDLDNNIIKHTNDAGKNWMDEQICLPIGMINLTNGVLDSVIDVYNGCGIMGQAVFVQEGVKVLISNGRNADGSLNNIEYTLDQLSVTKGLGHSSNNCPLFYNKFENLTSRAYSYFKQVEKPDEENITSAICYWENPLDNKVYRLWKNGGENSWHEVEAVRIGNITIDAKNYITNLFVTYQSVELLKSSDKSEISKWAMPSTNFIKLTLGKSGTEYTAPATGYVWVEKQGTTTAGVHKDYITIFTAPSTISSHQVLAGTNDYARAWLPVSRGSTFKVTYGFQNTTGIAFIFAYANGEV